MESRWKVDVALARNRPKTIQILNCVYCCPIVINTNFCVDLRQWLKNSSIISLRGSNLQLSEWTASDEPQPKHGKTES